MFACPPIARCRLDAFLAPSNHPELASRAHFNASFATATIPLNSMRTTSAMSGLISSGIPCASFLFLFFFLLSSHTSSSVCSHIPSTHPQSIWPCNHVCALHIAQLSARLSVRLPTPAHLTKVDCCSTRVSNRRSDPISQRSCFPQHGQRTCNALLLYVLFQYHPHSRSN